MTEDPRKTTPRSWASMYDEPGMGSQFGDLGPSYHPDDRSTAMRHARARQRRDHEAAAARDMSLIDRAADVDADNAALVEATKLRQEGREIPSTSGSGPPVRPGQRA
jgi:hypothetical protein